MAKRGRPVTAVVLTEEERDTLQRWARRAKSSQALAQRCSDRVGLCSEVNPTRTWLPRLGVWPQTVTKWRQRFVDESAGWAGRRAAPGRSAHDQRRAGRAGCGDHAGAPARRRHALVAGVDGRPSPGCRSRRWAGSGRRSGSSPTWSDTFKFSTDPQFIDKVRDVVGLYLDPPEKALVLCVDEKSQIQALDRSAPVLPMMPGHARAAHPRLRSSRHHHPVRRAGRGHRRGRSDRSTAGTAPPSS